MAKIARKRSKKMVVANWKMNPVTLEEARVIYNRTKKAVGQLARVKMVVCPPAPLLVSLSKSAKDGISLGAQDCSSKDSGAFTGDLSSLLVKNIGGAYVIVGHSERRAKGETDQEVSEKVSAALRNKLIPIVCIGEQVHDDEGKYLAFLKAQLFASLQGVSKNQIDHIIIAYEPVWAIGGKEAMNSKDIHGMTIYIKKMLAEFLGKREVPSVPILYGGAVNALNAHEIIREGMVDGLLVGRESVSSDFPDLLQAVNDEA